MKRKGLEIFKIIKNIIMDKISHVIEEIKKNTATSIILFILEVLVLVFTVGMILMEHSASWNIKSRCITSTYSFFEEILVKENSHIMDGFCLLWGMTITIVLFLIESGNTYWYGMRFKHIIEMSINKPVLIIGAIEYIILCPVTYMLEVKGLYKTCLWCIVLTFLVFAVVSFYAVVITGKSMIIHMIIRQSAQDLSEIIDKKESRYIEMKLQQLPISSVIINTSYEDSQEVEQLIENMQKIFHKKKINSMISRTFFNYVIVMTWVDQIVEKSGFSTEREKERTTYILKRLWEVIDEKLNDKSLIYAVEILLPLFYRETEDTNDIFVSVWDNMGSVRFEVLPYLFLYAEFCYRDRQQKFFRKYYYIFSRVRGDGKEFKEACGFWAEQTKRQTARRFWLSWAVCRDKSNYIGLTGFIEFCHDVTMISWNNEPTVKTYTMKKIRNILQ